MLRRVATALLVATFFLPRPARADDLPQDQAAFADVAVDGVDAGERTILVANDGDVLVRVEDAAALDVPVRAVARRTVGTQSCLSLRALAPDVTFAFDEERLRLTIQVAAKLIGTTTLSLDNASAPSALDRSRPASAFGNYFLSDTSGAGTSGFVEAGFSKADRLLYTSDSISGGALVRGDSYLAIDDPARTRRVQIGDTAANGDGLVDDASFFGISTRRAFELDPYAYRFPSPVVSGIVGAPGNADVYINGVVTRTIPLLPGGFNLTNLPVETGRNDVTVVVRDAAGVVQTYSQKYYRADSLLRKGLTDDTFGVGFVRAAAPAMTYGRPALFGAYRLGATNAATYGGRVEASGSDVVGESTADLRIPAGGVHLAVAGSRSARGLGLAFDGAVTVQIATTTVSADASSHSDAFRDLQTTPAILALATARASVTISQQVGRALSLLASERSERFGTLPMQRIATIGTNALLGRDTSAFVAVQRSRVGSATPSTYATISLVRTFGNGRTAVASTDRGIGATTSLQYRADPRSSETGFGYGLRYDRTQIGTDAQADLVDHTPYADLNALVQRDPGGKLLGDVAIGGGIASVGGRTLMTRPVADAFALVEVGAAGLDVSLDGRPVGRTNARGDLLVGSLAPYAENRLAVATDGLPVDREIETGQRLVSPGYRGGSVAKLAVTTVHYAIGSVRLVAGTTTVVPLDGMLTLDGRGHHVRSPLDDDGGYYFENLAPGTYAARVVSSAGTCSFAFVVPADAGRIATDLGTSRCARE